ncbi:MAG: ABC transporter permease subunit [Myxococcota bacterium]|nr:ABC transporter permease subunit [Myxococcota bacterium]
MTGILLRKELKERVRSLKAPGILFLFFAVGLVAPLITVLSPYFLLLVQDEEVKKMLRPVLSDPTLQMGLVQYVKLLGFIPFTVVLLSMDSFAGERASGVMEYECSFPIERSNILYVKLMADGLILLFGVLLCALGCFIITLFLPGELHYPGFLAVHGLLYLFLIFLMAVMTYAGLLVRSIPVVASVGFVGYLFLRGFAAIPTIGPYTPGGLFSAAMALATAQDPIEIEWCIGLSTLFIVILIFSSKLKLQTMEI